MLCLRCETRNLSRIDDTQWGCFRCGWIEENPRLSEMIGHRHPSKKPPRTIDSTETKEVAAS